MSGNQPSSLRLRPAVYFCTERGKHSRFLFLGVDKAIATAVANNNGEWLKFFTKNRVKIEETLINRKSLINQWLASVNSSQRISRISDMLNFLKLWSLCAIGTQRTGVWSARSWCHPLLIVKLGLDDGGYVSIPDLQAKLQDDAEDLGRAPPVGCPR